MNESYNIYTNLTQSCSVLDYYPIYYSLIIAIPDSALLIFKFVPS